jgi:hypothetical protein
VAGATVLIVFIVVLVIVATVLVLRTKNQDDLDKKTSNHLPLPVDYASNEGIFRLFPCLLEEWICWIRLRFSNQIHQICANNICTLF